MGRMSMALRRSQRSTSAADSPQGEHGHHLDDQEGWAVRLPIADQTDAMNTTAAAPTNVPTSRSTQTSDELPSIDPLRIRWTSDAVERPIIYARDLRGGADRNRQIGTQRPLDRKS